MKLIVVVAAVLAATTSALADHTRFVPRATPAPIPAPQREPNPFAPYSRSLPRFQSAPAATSHQGSSRAGTDRPQPYSRSNPRFNPSRA